jgi:hypothetical protein
LETHDDLDLGDAGKRFDSIEHKGDLGVEVVTRGLPHHMTARS